MALPFLEVMGPMARAAVGDAGKSSEVGSPMRLVGISNPLGLMPVSFPSQGGSDYS